MPASLRERMTLDLHGLGPAIRAHARARNMAISSFARMALDKALDNKDVAIREPSDSQSKPNGPVVKVSIRVSSRIAQDLSTRARAAGLSNGAYLSALIDAAPVAVDHQAAVRALSVSTDHLATVAADLNHYTRSVRQATSQSPQQGDDDVQSLAREVRTHLGIAARLVADLKPIAAWRRNAGQRLDGGGTP